jgi:hypothetical protein
MRRTRLDATRSATKPTDLPTDSDWFCRKFASSCACSFSALFRLEKDTFFRPDGLCDKTEVATTL